MRCRVADPSDAFALGEAMADATATYRSFAPPGGEPLVAETQTAALEELLVSDDFWCLVAEHGYAIVARSRSCPLPRAPTSRAVGARAPASAVRPPQSLGQRSRHRAPRRSSRRAGGARVRGRPPICTGRTGLCPMLLRTRTVATHTRRVRGGFGLPAAEYRRDLTTRRSDRLSREWSWRATQWWVG